MGKIKKLSILAALLLIIGIAGALLTYQSGKEVRISQNKTAADSNYKNVVIDTDNAGVEIQPISSGPAKAVLSGKSSDQKQLDFTIKKEGSTLKIKVKEKQRKFYNFDFSFTSLKLKVYIPQKQYRSLTVHNDNGLIKAKDMKTDSLTLIVNNGYVDLKNIQSKHSSISADNGRMFLDKVTGDVKAAANNGEIKMIASDLERNITLDCDNGKVSIKTEKEPRNAAFHVRADNGKINILDKYQHDAVLGSGKYKIRLTTNNGSIEVKR
ncbi:Putative adhesin [Bacillus sp. OV322]|uniref:DUF4097 family beta strand repeat-containing protein n=1 Tax=Bacillus sp. OV322 TaxID=1882764 RepID=UPI0008DF9576|nr:DUF4097 family beta strand repeat-containing protein [Bacillus sp. OV322]SFC90636.1 Putative adhesin [Bacillus sp. OV322]